MSESFSYSQIFYLIILSYSHDLFLKLSSSNYSIISYIPNSVSSPNPKYFEYSSTQIPILFSLDLNHLSDLPWIYSLLHIYLSYYNYLEISYSLFSSIHSHLQPLELFFSIHLLYSQAPIFSKLVFGSLQLHFDPLFFFHQVLSVILEFLLYIVQHHLLISDSISLFF